MAEKDWDDPTITDDDTVSSSEFVDMAGEIKANTAKVSFDSTSSTKLGTIEEGAEVNVIESVADDTSPQLGGNLDLNSKGIILSSQTSDGSVSTGNLVYLDTTTWKQADADAEATCTGTLGIDLGSGNILIDGIWTTTGLTAGSDYYVSTTAGGITTTQPSTTGDIVRFIGTALSTTELLFKPDQTLVELA